MDRLVIIKIRVPFKKNESGGRKNAGGQFLFQTV